MAAIDHPDMPIASRPPGIATGQGGTSRRSHPGGALAVGSRPTPSEALLPSGGPDTERDPGRELALEALRLVCRLRAPGGRPGPWATETFDVEVDLVRRHLAPIRTRRSLTDSYAREASRDPAAGAPSSVRAAYAVRWLELGDGRPRPAWPTLIAGAA
jgi:hypothetical protein